jgi:toxin ParE1/3/4
MRVRWTHKSLADLDSIFEAIALDRPRVAEEVIRTLLAHSERLLAHPRRGRHGRVPQTREMVVPRLPYIVVYELTPSLVGIKPEVTVLRVIHGAMQWPPDLE